MVMEDTTGNRARDSAVSDVELVRGSDGDVSTQEVSCSRSIVCYSCFFIVSRPLLILKDSQRHHNATDCQLIHRSPDDHPSSTKALSPLQQSN